MAKKRKPEAQTGKEGVIHVMQVTNDAGHIFREVLNDDVGIDACIEVCQNGMPTGMLIGLQIKSGESYVHSEKPDSFTYYLKIDDLKYWQEYSLPVFLVIYRPSEKRAYWVDIKEFMKGHKFEDMLSGMAPRKCIVDKSSIFSENFFDILMLEFGDRTFVEWGYNLFLQSLLKVTSTRVPTYKVFDMVSDVSTSTEGESYDIPLDLRKSLFYLNTNSAIKLLNYLDSKQGELVEVLVRQQSTKEALAEEYVTELIVKVRALIFEKEGTGFILIAFEKEEDRDSVAKKLEALIPFNHYIILRGESLFLNSYMMNYILMVASDGWEHGQINIGDEFFPKLQQRFGLQWSRSYEFDFYGSKAASIFCTPNYYFEYTFETVCDTEDSFLLFDYMRTMGSCSQDENSEEYIWMSIGDDRIKIHESWDPALYGYFKCIRTIRSGGEWRPYYDFLLDVEFEITTETEREDFVAKAKAAKSFQDLPLMTDLMLEGIIDGVGDLEQLITGTIDTVLKPTWAESQTEAFKLISDFEKKFRVFIITRLENRHRQNWWEQGIKGDIKKKCQERLHKDSNNKNQQADIHNYMDFMDLYSLIEWNQNKDIFKPYFPRDLTRLKTKLDELSDIRNAVMHSKREINEKDLHRIKLYTDDICQWIYSTSNGMDQESGYQTSATRKI